MSVIAVLLGALVAAPWSSASEPPYRVTELTIDVTVGPDDDQSCRIVANLYKPRTATPEDPAPAILTTHGFGGSKDSGDQVGIGRGFAELGYVVLSYSGLGFGGSECKIYLDDRDWDGEAGAQLVEVLAGERAAADADGDPYPIDFVQLDAPGDPRVGMVGGSYGGQIQYAVAALTQKVDALVPIITWNDLAYSLAPSNAGLERGVGSGTPGVHKKQWTSFFFGAGIASGAEHVTVDPTRMVGCPNFYDPICAAKAQIDALGYPTPQTTALVRHASVASYLDRITAPTLLLQGQKDTLFNLQEAVATYRALRAQGTPVAMVWQSWGHSLGGTPVPGELDLGADDVRDTYLGRRIADWFDRWLRDDRTAPAGPGFEYFRDWVYEVTGSAAEAYAHAGSYPVGRPSAFYLSGPNRLTTGPSRVRAGAQSFITGAGSAPTSYSETSALEGVTVNHPPSDTPGTFAAWTSAPLTRDLAIVGVPTLDVQLDAPTAEVSQRQGPAGMLVLFAKLYDIAPDGTKILKNRLVSPVRVADAGEPLHIELPGVVHRVAAGHRLQVVLAAGDAAYAGNSLSHRVTVRTGRHQPGVLRLPVVGPAPATGEAP